MATLVSLTESCNKEFDILHPPNPSAAAPPPVFSLVCFLFLWSSPSTSSCQKLWALKFKISRVSLQKIKHDFMAASSPDVICTCFGHLCFFLLIFILIIPVVLLTKRERWHKDNMLPHLLWCAADADGVYRFSGRPSDQHTPLHHVSSSSRTDCFNKYSDPW